MNKLLAPIALLVLLAGSCKKNDTTSIPTTTNNFKTYGSIDEIFSLLSLQPKVVNVDATTGATFYGNSGTRYVFQPNCFVDGNGNTVAGNISVEVTEYLKKGDMIFSEVLPISNGEPLISGGEIKVKATKSGVDVFIKPGMALQANIPQSGTDTTMSFFRGRNTGTGHNKVNWAIPDTAGKSTAVVSITTSSVTPVMVNTIVKYKDTLCVITDSIGLCNADRFIEYSTIKWQSFTVKISIGGKTPTSSSLNTYALYDSYKGLWALNNVRETTYTEDHVPDIPVHFVSFGLVDGHFYGGVSPATPKTGESYTITLTEVDPVAFKAQINGLY